MSYPKWISVLGEFFRRHTRKNDIDATYEGNMNRADFIHAARPATQHLVDPRREQRVDDVVAQVAQAGDDIGYAFEVHAKLTLLMPPIRR
jgi:hypothetical protein